MILGHSLRGTGILIGESDRFHGMFIYLHVAFGTGTAFATYTSHTWHHVKRFLHVIISSVRLKLLVMVAFSSFQVSCNRLEV